MRESLSLCVYVQYCNLSLSCRSLSPSLSLSLPVLLSLSLTLSFPLFLSLSLSLPVLLSLSLSLLFSAPLHPSGTSIIQVTATDADDPTYGNSARLVYTLVQGQQYFSVDPQTGE